MKMPKATQRPSGNWRVQLMIDGNMMSVTGNTEEEAVLKAMSIKHGAEQYKREPLSITLSEAYDRYIESKDSVLSPSTIYGYKKLKRNTFQGVMDRSLKALSNEQVQREINKMAKTLSPKTLRNANGLLNAVLTEYHPDMRLKTTLPQKQKVEVNIPTEEEIRSICLAAKGKTIELPIMLAICLGLRASEICGIRWDAIKGNALHIKEAKVYTEEGNVSKSTKSYSGDRKLKLPGHILELISTQPNTNEYVVQLSGGAIYKRFSRLCEKHGIQHLRFHDLRHANASVMLALGIPDKYAMERMGHATSNMLKTVYQHTMSDKMEAVHDQVNDYFSALISPNISPDK